MLTSTDFKIGDEVHITNSRLPNAMVVKVYEHNGKLVVDVPNILLQTTYPIVAFRYIDDGKSGYTIDKYEFTVNQKPKPDDYVYTETEVWTAEKAVENALQEAKDSGEFKGDKGEPGEPGKDGIDGIDGIDGVGRDTSSGGVIFNDYENNSADAKYATAFGTESKASGEASLAFGMKKDRSGAPELDDPAFKDSDWRYNEAIGEASVAGGMGAIAYARASKSMGYRTQTGYPPSVEHAKKRPEAVTMKDASGNVVYPADNEGQGAVAIGADTAAVGKQSLATGTRSKAFGNSSRASGLDCVATGRASSTDGCENVAEGDYSTAQGYQCKAKGFSTVSQGQANEALANAAIAQGWGTSARGAASTSGGRETIANGYGSAALGVGNVANGFGQFVIGTHNLIDTTKPNPQPAWTNQPQQQGKYVFIVGNGTGSNRSNAHTIDWDGYGWYKGGIKLHNEFDSDLVLHACIAPGYGHNSLYVRGGLMVDNGVYLSSPDGNRWRLTVDNNGNLHTEAT